MTNATLYVAPSVSFANIKLFRSENTLSTYDVNSKDYLGDGEDAAHHTFNAFRIGQEIHVVYDLGEQNQVIATADVYEVSSNPDKYLWTPFAQFALVECDKVVK